MLIDRRLLFGLAAALPIGKAFAQNFPPPVPDVPRSEVENTALAKANEALVRRQSEVQNTGNVPATVQFFAENTRNHGVAVGRNGIQRVLTDIFTTFPDFRSEIIDLAAIGDDVIARRIDTGTHKGVAKIPFNGGLLVGVPPTGKRFKVQSIHWLTFEKGLIIEHRASRDDIGMMQQLGLLPMTTRYDLPKVS
jgi:predicted ester cyclase